MRYLYFQSKSSLPTNKRWVTPHHQNIISLLQSCSKREELIQIHAQMIRSRLIEDTFYVSRIIAFLAAPSPRSSMAYARRVFDQIHQPNLFSWNSMIRGYANCDAPRDALSLYKLMLRRGFSPDSYTFAVVTKACAHLNALEAGETVRGSVLKCGLESDMFVMTGFINLYAGCGEVNIAREVFDEMRRRDVVSWTSMLSGYARVNRWDEAFLLFDEMRVTGIEPNKVTIMSLISACGQLRALDKGRRLHLRIIENGMERDADVANSIMNMYAKCGSMRNAAEVFERMPVKNSISWNTLVGGFARNGLYKEALTMFQEMACSEVKPDEITIIGALSACAQLGDLQQGKLLHAYIEGRMIARNLFVTNALVNMYAKCGDLAKAEAIFRGMPQRDVFSWTAIISGFVQVSGCKKALSLFEEMQLTDVEPNEVTLVSALSACSQLGALDQGRQIHACIEENNVGKDVCLGNALMDMYAKCGCIEIASRIFHGMPLKDTLSWNTMIGGLATHGHGRAAIDLFNQMQKIGDAEPDSVTLLAVLCACSHSGMVHEGIFYFSSMSSSYGIVPEVEHYGCMVDLLSRAGLIGEASDFIKNMPIAPNSVIWGSLLASCRVHHKMELGQKIAQHIIEIAPNDEGAHVLISNLYAEAGRWDDVRQVRTLMGSRGMEKSPGCSSIEVNGVVHEFFVGDKLLHQYGMIYLVLDGLTHQMNQTVCESCCTL
ncbi:pentatricopeptide repeat-containing protein At1g15510, chloroplastic-like [Phoenix dactylifera]|uniref:Pentatricopeptide repeat-containing protein At1g15510, chloroplastic-like n=1 Tax=Phoenix dactylifera TaxID=42345 RepID=A0A8B8ZUI2_PHODC|nr:pentatricopeptide repeat-containing protein At1g15510, chloroplastic-like [Phoenix dactylifera]